MEKIRQQAQEVAERRKRYTRMTFARTAEVAEAAVAHLAEAEGGSAPTVIEIAPHITRPLTRLPDDRRATFAAALDEMLDIAFGEEAETAAALADPDTMRNWEDPDDTDLRTRQSQIDDEPMTLTAACIACQGSCCTQGAATHGFLSERTLSSVRAVRPELDREGVRALYMDAIPDETIRDSCVFHGPLGCTLTRETRSGLCNRWECGYRQRLRPKLAETNADRVVVAGIVEDHMEQPEAGRPEMKIVSVGPRSGVTVDAETPAPALPTSDPQSE